MKLELNTHIDSQAIKALFTRTFADSEGEQEGLLIGQLAHDIVTTAEPDSLAVYTASSMDESSELLAAIVFTPLVFESSVCAYLLSPVAVSTAHQGQGIGQALIRFALEDLQKKGVSFVVTYGDPQFYAKTGFVPVTTEQVPSPQPLSMPQGWLAVALTPQGLPAVSGPVRCTLALDRPEFW